MSHIQHVINRDVGTGWHIQHCVRPPDIVLAVRKVELLPDPVDPVNLRMVEVKSRVTRRNERVSAGVTADGKVSAAVDADVVGDEPGIRFQENVEIPVGRGGQKHVGRVAERGEGAGEVTVQVALETPRVVEVRVLLHGEVSGGAVVWQDHGTQVDDHVGEGTRVHAPAARAGREGDRVRVAWEHELQALVRDVFAVAAEGGVGAVEKGREARVLCVEAPLPVGEVSCPSLSARRSQCLL